MGKKVKHAGSRLLGEELRRLRFGRSHAQVCALFRRPPLAGVVEPISAATLSRIESGVAMPSLENVHALGALYRVSEQRLVNVVAEERLIAGIRVPRTLPAVHARFRERLAAGRWREALALAVQGERLSRDEDTRHAWRANRATCLAKVGMRQDATFRLLECAETPGTQPERRSRQWLNLANAFASSGFLAMAADCAKASAEGMPKDAPAELTVASLRTRARILLMQHEAEGGKDRKLVDEAATLLAGARPLVAPGDVATTLTLDIEAALAAHALGKRSVAIRDLERIASKARSRRLDVIETWATANLGSVLHASGRLEEAETTLVRAARRAGRQELLDEAFELYFELYHVAMERGEEKQGKRYLEKCKTFHPLVEARTATMREFEKLTGVVR